MGSSSGVVGGVVGAVVGFYVTGGNPYGAQIGWMIGSGIGNYYAYKNQDDIRQEGPKLDDLKVQISSYGIAIPYIRGAIRIAGNVIDKTDLVPHTTETSEEAGKGGGGPSNITTTTTYTVSLDIGLCHNQILGIKKIWGNKKLIYDMDAGLQDPCISQMRVYTGSETQDADPLFTALHGSVPNYLGLSRVVLEDLDVTAQFFNRPPQLEFLVVADGSVGFGDLVVAGGGGSIAALDTETGYVWSSWQEDSGVGGDMHVYITNWRNATLVNSFIVAGSSVGDGAIGMCYATQHHEIWIPRENGGAEIEVFSGTGMTHLFGITDGLGNYGLCRYDPFNDLVWRCRTGTDSKIRVYNAESHGFASEHTMSISDGQAISEVIFINDHLAAVLVSSAVIMLNSLNFGEEDVIPHGGDAIAGNVGSKMAYDSSRGRLILTNMSVGTNLIEINISTSTATLHSIGFTPINCVWMPTQDRYVLMSNTGDMIRIINPDDWSIEASETPAGFTAGAGGDYLRIPGDNGYIWHGGVADHTSYKIPVGDIIQSTGVLLSELVSDICVLSGLDPSDVDVTDLSGDTVDGYALASQMTGRAAIEALQQAFYFDAVESDDVLKFVKRGGAIAGTMLQDDRAGPSGNLDSDLQITHMSDDLELPGQVDVNYFDLNADYLIGTQYERRLTTEALSTAGITLPLAMSATRAKECAAVSLYTSALRQSFAWSTTRKYAQFEPTDVVTLPTASATYHARITSKRDTSEGRIEWEGMAEDSNVYSQTVVGAELGYVPATVKIPPATTLRLLDINLVRDQDDANGFYGAATGVEPWTGAQLLRSIDNGQSYQTVTSFTSPATIGTTITELGDWTGGSIFEFANSVDVILVRGSLANATEEEVLNGANACVIGDEIVQFQNAELIATDTYRLSGLLRGRRGTESFKSSHAIGERFVLADTATWRNIWQDTSGIGISYKYRAPTFGQTLAQATVYDFTNTAARLKPYAPDHVTGVRDGSNNLTITWIPRARVDGEWRDGVETPLSDLDVYDIDVYDPTFTTLKRTIANISGPSDTYSAANQTTDGYTPGDPVSIEVFEKSSVVGRGYGVRAIV